MNIEYRRKAFYRSLLIKKAERSDSTLRNFAVRYSIFCSSLFSLAAEAASLIIKKPNRTNSMERPGGN
jgi:hypothetical protein